MASYEEVAEYAISLGLKEGFDYVEVYVEESEGFSYSIVQGKHGGASRSRSSGIRLRLISKGSLYTFSTNLINKSIVKKAFRFKQFKGNNIKLSDEKAQKADYKAKERLKIEDSYDKLAKDLEDLDNLIKERATYRSVFGAIGRSKSYFVNSEGSVIRSNIPSITFYISFIIGKGKESRERLIEIGSSGGYENFNFEKVGKGLNEEMKNLSNLIEKGVSLSGYELSKIKNVVVSPEIVGIAVHESVGHPSEADRVFGREAAQAGTSYLNGSNFGIKIGSELVNIVDDPTIEGSYGFYLYDEEGVKAREKLLVKEGVQNELLLNREYAGLLDTKSNASSISDSYHNEPIIRMSNTFLKKGDADFDELIKEAKNGVYVKSFTEWNIDDTRSFARYQGNEAYLIKNGSIEEPVKNYKLDSSTFDFWRSVKLLSNEFKLYPGVCGKGEPMQGVSVTMGGPSALLSFGERE